MAEIVNLNRVRKARARAEAAARAAVNRADHGRTPAERSVAAAEAATRDKVLDAAKLDSSDGDGEPRK